MVERTYTADDLEKATAGFLNKSILQNWHSRDLWITPTEAPGQGRPRSYRICHLIEAAIRSELVRLEFSHEAARHAIRSRLREAFPRKGAGYAAELDAKIVYLRDFNDEDAVWLVIPEVATIAARRDARLSDLFERMTPAAGFVILDVGAIVKRLRHEFDSPSGERSK